MTEPLNILIIDDSHDDFLLLVQYLERNDLSVRCRQVDSLDGLQKAIDGESWNLVFSDYTVPALDFMDSLNMIQLALPDLPVIMVTGTVGEELAVEFLKLGVCDVVLKDNLTRLLPAVQRALKEKRELEERRRTQVRLRESEAMYRSLLEREVTARTKLLDEQLHFLQTLIDAIPVPVYYKDTDCVYMGCNRAFEQVIHRSRESIIGETAAAIHQPGLAQAFQEKDCKVLQEGGVQTYETDIVYPDGSLHTGIVHKASFSDSRGKIAGLVGVRLDITELKETEKSLRTSEGKLLSIMDNLHIGVAMISPQMELLQVNRQIRQWFPNAVTERGARCYQVFIDQSQQAPCESCSVKKIFSLGESQESIIKLQTSGGERMMRTVASPIFNEAGDITAAIQIYEDITEKLAIERELSQAQKLEAIGQLAAGIAHEINTPIQYIGDNIHFLEDAFNGLLGIHEKYVRLVRALKTSGPISEIVREVEENIDEVDLDFLFTEIPKTVTQTLDGVNRVSAIVRAMREFSHPGSDEKSQVDINRAIESTLTVSRNEWKYVADVETDLAPDLPLLSCLPGEINQMILNIIINAAHAIGEVTDGGNNGKGLIRVTTCAHDGWLEIRIADTGGGIPQPVKHRIFDPFFTTKKLGKGTGQGLAIARSVVVDKHQGTLNFESEVGKGTTFIIQLPIH